MRKELPEDSQERYDYLIQFINNLEIDNDDKELLIEKVDDVITWILTSE